MNYADMSKEQLINDLLEKDQIIKELQKDYKKKSFIRSL